MNEIHYQIDHDFRNLTKLVWHFCDFSTLFGGFMKFLQMRKRKIKFPPGTRLRGQPAVAAAHADARPRHTARARGPDAGGTRPARRGARPAA